MSKLRVVPAVPLCFLAFLSVALESNAQSAAASAVDKRPVDPRPIDPRIAAFETGLRGESEDATERWSIAERMAYYRIPGASVAVIRDGRLAWAKGYGVLQTGSADRVDTETVFSVGSVSKVGAAAATLRLVDAGKLKLDRYVNEFLKSFKVPENEFTEKSPVTLRRILSHTAGFTVHGFKDFQPGEKLPTTIDILEGRAPAKNIPVRVDFEPGSRFRYSGGGITLEQLIIEEATGKGFAAAARELVFAPLGMKRSTYVNPLPVAHGNIAKAHSARGKPRALPRGFEAMPEAAASGLWTTPAEFSRLIIALIQSYRGAKGAFLKQSLARDMMTAVQPSQFGLGPQIESGAGGVEGRRFSHGGANDSYKAWIEGHLATGNGFVVFTNSVRGKSLIAELKRSIAAAEDWK